MPRKAASENVIYLCRLLNILAKLFKPYSFCIQANRLDPDQTAPRSQADDKVDEQTTVVVTDSLRVKTRQQNSFFLFFF